MVKSHLLQLPLDDGQVLTCLSTSNLVQFRIKEIYTRPWPWCDFGIGLWPRSLAGPFSLLKNKHLAQVLVYTTRGQLYFWYLLKLIQYDTPGPMRLADWALGPLSLLQNKHLARVLAEQHSGPFVHL